jgi:hypothetical protein
MLFGGSGPRLRSFRSPLRQTRSPTRSRDLFRSGDVCSEREPVAAVKIAVIAVAIIVGFSVMVMPALVRMIALDVHAALSTSGAVSSRLRALQRRAIAEVSAAVVDINLGFFTGAGWAIATSLVGRILRF